MSDEGALMALRLMATRKLLNKHGLTNWRVDFADLSGVRTRNLVGESFGVLGICVFQDRRILIDPSLISSRNKFRGTVLHEIAHARYGRMGHGPGWLAVARKVGCTERSLEPYRIVLQ